MRLIIERYLMREVATTFLGVSLILMLMFFSATFIRLLTETVEGDYPVSILFSLFALKGVGNIVFILPFAFFIAVLLAFGKLYKDNEIVVLLACGAGPRRLYVSVGMLALVLSLIVGYLALFFAPWAEDKSYQLLDEAGARQEIEGIVPGRFNTFGPGSPAIYVEGFDRENKRLKGIFVQGEDEGVQYVMNAQRAYERTDKETGARYLVLQDGYRYEGVQGQRDYRIIHFAEHGIRIRAREVVASSRNRFAIASSALWQSTDRSDLAELHWRIAVPVSTFLLALLAVPLSKSSPRGGRYAGLFFGILLYVFYNNLLTVGRSAMAKGEVPPELGLWWVHLLAAMLLALIVWKQQRVPKGGSRR